MFMTKLCLNLNSKLKIQDYPDVQLYLIACYRLIGSYGLCLNDFINIFKNSVHNMFIVKFFQFEVGYYCQIVYYLDFTLRIVGPCIFHIL